MSGWGDLIGTQIHVQGGGLVAGSNDTVGALFRAWRADIDSEPQPAMVALQATVALRDTNRSVDGRCRGLTGRPGLCPVLPMC